MVNRINSAEYPEESAGPDHFRLDRAINRLEGEAAFPEFWSADQWERRTKTGPTAGFSVISPQVKPLMPGSMPWV